ncbi:putative transcriptional regulatory protein [Cyphellophora attinorum]|uniref:Putative transcriptional regulatory protein n=1 Tax=Cyphellophora attinorum TaxID=1664694 RepID=A0A0N1H199_9EURO|nr:putative transcriptional regulatory protein [Phialophora attinorum]KPI37813.1 putative transcriptional regulatory protein [Phialophora attinorum]
MAVSTTGSQVSPSKKESEAKKRPELKERRKRNCTKKTRTGCLTCKQRRVKCDEHKPACWNCLKSSARVCEGFPFVKPDDVEPDNGFHVRLETGFNVPATTPSSTFGSIQSLLSTDSSASGTPTGLHLPQPSPHWRESQYTPPSSASSGNYGDEPSYFLHHATKYRSPWTSAGPADGILTGTLSDNNGVLTLPPIMRTHFSWPSTAQAVEQHKPYKVPQTPDLILDGPTRPPARRTKSAEYVDRSRQPTSQIGLPLARTLDVSPFADHPQAAHSFEFYMAHTGAAMGARSSELFFLYTIPQVAAQYDFVRYALLATSLVDESVDDTFTDQGRQGPGIECVNFEARRLSFEMYGRSVRALCAAQSKHHATYRDTDNALAASLITCILLSSFEYWLWNIQNASRHIDGARELIQNYEKTSAGQEKRAGLLQGQVLEMLNTATRFHEMSVKFKMPASHCTEGRTWGPERPLAAV